MSFLQMGEVEFVRFQHFCVSSQLIYINGLDGCVLLKLKQAHYYSFIALRNSNRVCNPSMLTTVFLSLSQPPSRHCGTKAAGKCCFPDYTEEVLRPGQT